MSQDALGEVRHAGNDVRSEHSQGLQQLLAPAITECESHIGARLTPRLCADVPSSGPDQPG